MNMWIPWWGAIPFVVLLACIALAPLIPHVRDRWAHLPAQLTVALALGIPVGVWMCLRGQPSAVVHALVEYAQFITLLFSLYVVSGGILAEGDIRATPRNNAIFLSIGAVVASFIGTTGAAMLLVRPILNTNHQRRHRTHTMVFAIFIVANAGGLLTPLGDPPLFLGMLRGVPFLWTMHLAGEWLLVNTLLIVTFWGLDRRLYAQEPMAALQADALQVQPLRVRGWGQLVLLGAIVASAALLPSVHLDALHAEQVAWWEFVPVRELAMLTTAVLSLKLGDRSARERNRFTWGPILEVAALFVGIFLTMIPALRIVAQWAPRLPIGKVSLFLMTGSLSSVLDNAPTYSVFFELAKQGEGATRVAGVPEPLLVAVSLGAVFCGAMTYIGNGPNFMVKSIAESEKVPMPTFGGYVFRWALPLYVPALVAMLLLFLTDATWTRVTGALLAIVIAAAWLLVGIRHPAPVLETAPDSDRPIDASLASREPASPCARP